MREHGAEQPMQQKMIFPLSGERRKEEKMGGRQKKKRKIDYYNFCFYFYRFFHFEGGGQRVGLEQRREG